MKLAVFFSALFLISFAQSEEIIDQLVDNKIQTVAADGPVNPVKVEYKITQIDNNSNVIAIKNDPPLENAIEKEFIAQDESGRQCAFPVIEVKGEFLIASTQDCVFSKDLRAEQVLVLSVMTGFSKKDEEKTGPIPTKDEQLPKIVNQNETWYTKFNIGMSSVSYPSTLQEAIDRLESTDGVSHTPLALDFGIYWPTSQTSLVGASMSGVGDRYSYSNNYLQINQYLLGVSFMRFFGQSIGSGVFFRTDLGISWFNLTASTANASVNESSNKGFGALIAIGYGVPISNETRVLFELSFANRKDGDDERVKTLAGTVGFLW